VFFQGMHPSGHINDDNSDFMTFSQGVVLLDPGTMTIGATAKRHMWTLL
jgi:hypothetical protein